MLELSEAMIRRVRYKMVHKTAKAFAMLLVAIAIFPQPGWSETQRAKVDKTPKSAPTEIRVLGAGSGSPYPLFQLWIAAYVRLHPGTPISYDSVSSGFGVRKLLSREVFFAAIDAPLTDDQLARANGRVIQLPVTVQGVGPIYNLAGVPLLRFSGSTLADIFLGRITKWNDAALARDNPGVDLPQMEIKLYHHLPDGSLDTRLIADYLSKVSPEFEAALPRSSRNWPAPSRIYKGGDAWTGFVARTPGAIGYSWRIASFPEGVQFGEVRNAEGEFAAAAPETLTAASASAVPLVRTQGSDFRVSITNASGKTAYPIASFVWIALYERSGDKEKHKVMLDFLKWILTDGQTLARKHGYAPLADDLLQLELQNLDRLEKH